MSEEITRHLREDVVVPFLEGRLPGAERTGVEEHLGRCRNCREHMADLRAVLEELDGWLASEPSGAFDAAVRQRITAEGGESAGWRTWRLRPLWAAALALALIMAGGAGVWLLPPGETPLDGAEVFRAGDVDAVDAVFAADPEEEDTLAAIENARWLADYELIQEFDALFEDGENGESPL